MADATTAAPTAPAPNAATPDVVKSTTGTPAPSQPEAAKPIDPIEGELSAKYGEKWTALSDDMKAQVVSAEKKSRDADRRYQMVAKLQKDHDLTQRQAAQLLDVLANDPGAVFQNPELMKRLNRGKLREFAERIVWEGIQEERMDPKDRRLAELEKFQQETLAERKAREDAEQKSAADAKLEKDIAERRTHWEREIVGALKVAGIEADGVFVAQMARYIQACRRSNQAVDLPRIIQQVQSDFNGWQMRYLMSGFKPRQEGESNEAFAGRYETFLSRLNPQLVELIRSGDLAKLKNKNMGRPAGSTRTEPKKDPSKKISMSEWLEQREARLGRK